jgi:hypothetical protein
MGGYFQTLCGDESLQETSNDNIYHERNERIILSVNWKIERKFWLV